MIGREHPALLKMPPHTSVEMRYLSRLFLRSGNAKTVVVVPVVWIVPVAVIAAEVVCIVVVPRTAAKHAIRAPVSPHKAKHRFAAMPFSSIRQAVCQAQWYALPRVDTALAWCNPILPQYADKRVAN